MPINISKYIISTIFIIVVGSLFHFIYQLSNDSPVVGIFGAVNESTWEHLKLLFWPFILFSLYEYFINKNNSTNFFTATFISVFIGMFLIVSLFYTYTGILGDNYFIVDILIFVVAVVISNYIYLKLLSSNYLLNDKLNIVSLILIITLILLFVFFTFNPPKIPLFRDPNSLEYGVK